MSDELILRGLSPNEAQPTRDLGRQEMFVIPPTVSECRKSPSCNAAAEV